MKKAQRKNQNEKGQSLVELTFSLTFMLLLLAGVIDLGRAFFTYIALRDAAQEGAAYASIARADDSDAMACSDIEARIRDTSDTAIVNLQSGDVAIDIFLGGTACASATDADACFGEDVQIILTYGAFPLTTPFLGTVLGTQTIPIQASIVDTILTPPCD